MPNEVSCPDPDEVVTRKILAEELAATHEQLRRQLSEDIAGQLRGYEEKRRMERAQEFSMLLQEARDATRSMLDERPTSAQFSDHENRLIRLETRPAKRARKPVKRTKR